MSAIITATLVTANATKRTITTMAAVARVFFALGVCLCCRKRRRDGTYGGCCSRCQDDEPPTSTLRAPLTNNRRVQASSTTNNHRAQAPSGINTCVQHLAPVPLPIAPMPPPLVQGTAVAGPSAQSVGEPTNQSAGGNLALSVARALNIPPEEARGKLQRLNDKEKAAVAAKDYLEAGQVAHALTDVKELSACVAKLVEEEKEAVENREYKAAEALKRQIDEMTTVLSATLDA